MNAVRSNVAHTLYDAILLHQLIHVRVHDQLEFRIFHGFGSEKFEEAHLREQKDVRKTRLEALQIEWAEGTVCKLDRQTGNLGVRNFEKFIRQADLVENFHA